MSIKTIIKVIVPRIAIIAVRKMEMKIHQQRGMVYRNRINKRKGIKDVLNILFIVYQPQSWNSLKPVYTCARRDSRINAQLLVLPYEYRDSVGLTHTSYDFFKKEDENIIAAYSEKKWIKIKKFKPDIVFRQSPYDAAYPTEYKGKRIAKYARFCYIPYNYNFSPYKHLEIEYNEMFLAYVHTLFIDSETINEYCRQKIQKNKYLNNINVINTGFPRFDYLKEWGRNQDTNNTFIWIPRWSLDTDNNNGSGFFKYLNTLLDFFLLHLEYRLIIRPHPMMFDNFIQVGAMTKQEVEELKDKIHNTPNITFDDNMDYLLTFKQAGIMIADFSSLVVEYFLTGNPVIYCGKIDENDFNSETIEMAQSFYHVDDEEALVSVMKELIRGNDEKEALRLELIRKFLESQNDDISRKIINKCFEI